MNAFRMGTCVALSLATAACGTWSVDADVDALRSVEPRGMAFTKALAGEYRQIAGFEAGEMQDWVDADHFARKGLRAARGEIVDPEALEDWRIPDDKVDELSRARDRLVTALEMGGWIDAPEKAASAQANFDCWVEQQEENWQWEHIAACRDAFYVAMDHTESEMVAARKSRSAGSAAGASGAGDSAGVMHVTAGGHDVQLVLAFFRHDTADITPATRAEIHDAVNNGKQSNIVWVEVSGHADRSGPETYNDRLSHARAESVKSELVKAGLPEKVIQIASYGERSPFVRTADGVREPLNRRVEVIIEAADPQTSDDTMRRE